MIFLINFAVLVFMMKINLVNICWKSINMFYMITIFINFILFLLFPPLFIELFLLHQATSLVKRQLKHSIYLIFLLSLEFDSERALRSELKAGKEWINHFIICDWKILLFQIFYQWFHHKIIFLYFLIFSPITISWISKIHRILMRWL